MFLQLVEQRHRLLLRKMDAQLFNDLIVVRTDGTELGVEVRQFGVVVHQRLVHFQHLEQRPEQQRLQRARTLPAGNHRLAAELTDEKRSGAFPSFTKINPRFHTAEFRFPRNSVFSVI